MALASKSQTVMVLRLLRAGWTSPMAALRRVGCMRLAARVYDLRRAGVRVKFRDVAENGKRWREYRVKKEGVACG